MLIAVGDELVARGAEQIMAALRVPALLSSTRMVQQASSFAPAASKRRASSRRPRCHCAWASQARPSIALMQSFPDWHHGIGGDCCVPAPVAAIRGRADADGDS